MALTKSKYAPGMATPYPAKSTPRAPAGTGAPVGPITAPIPRASVYQSPTPSGSTKLP